MPTDVELESGKSESEHVSAVSIATDHEFSRESPYSKLNSNLKESHTYDTVSPAIQNDVDTRSWCCV